MSHDSAFAIPKGRSISQTLIVYVEDRPGTLNRIVSLFRRRGFNIDSLTVGRCERPGVSRITVESTGTQEKLDGLIEVLQPFGILELVRTGAVAMLRGPGSGAQPEQTESDDGVAA